MKKLMAVSFIFIAALCVGLDVQSKSDDFSSVVKVIERVYHVKHKSLPFLARAGIKTAGAVGRLAGGMKRHIAEAGSVKVAFFEDQDFESTGGVATLKTALGAVLNAEWSPLVQVASARGHEQTFVYLREAGDKFNVLVVTIEPREACVVQVTVSPRTLAQLMKNPDEMGSSITADATTEDQ
jgi:hypothetical protein